MEETAFEWELTNYPLMQATVDKLNPFLNLYETSMEFMNKQKTWFESPMGTHDPKVILKTNSLKISILCEYSVPLEQYTYAYILYFRTLMVRLTVLGN